MKAITFLTLGLGLLGGAQAQTVTPRTSSATEVLTLSAVPGTQVTYLTTTKIEFTGFDVSFAPKPGKTLSAEDQAKLSEISSATKSQMAEVQAELGSAIQESEGKQFVRVLPPDVRGNAVLQTSLVSPAPVIDLKTNRVTVSKTQFVTTTTQQTFAPDGKLLNLSIKSSDPKLQKFYSAMKFDELLGQMGQSGQGSLYGLALKAGESRNSTQSVDLSSLLSGLGALLMGETDVSQSLKSQPLTLNVATTYLGKSTAGIRSYQQRFTASPWKLSLKGGAGTSALNIRTTAWSGQGGQSYRPDGLPQTRDSAQDVSMIMTMDMPDLPVQMQLQMDMKLTTSIAANDGS
ncbi:hypothetical protein [Deinococcus sp.]|uniref:hypothetical protein n=1 Tax=Deinococcus sp. TaxID=47478 RepID=UPI003B5B3B9A